MENVWKIHLQSRELMASGCITLRDLRLNTVVCPQWDGKPPVTSPGSKLDTAFCAREHHNKQHKWKSEEDSQNRWGWSTPLEIARSNSPTYCRCDNSRLLRTISTWGLDILRYWDCAKSLHHLFQCLKNFAEEMFFSCLSVICLISVCAHPLTEKSMPFFLWRHLCTLVWSPLSLLYSRMNAQLSWPLLVWQTLIPSPSSWPLAGRAPVAPFSCTGEPSTRLRTPDVSH